MISLEAWGNIFFASLFIAVISIIPGIYHLVKYNEMSRITKDIKKLTKSLFRVFLYLLVIPVISICTANISFKRMVLLSKTQSDIGLGGGMSSFVSEHGFFKGNLTLYSILLLIAAFLIFYWFSLRIKAGKGLKPDKKVMIYLTAFILVSFIITMFLNLYVVFIFAYIILVYFILKEKGVIK